MNRVVVAIVLLTACGDDPKPTGSCNDKGVCIFDVPYIPPMPCDPLVQSNCMAGEKCTWILDTVAPRGGHVGCAPDEVGSEGESGRFGPAGPTGYDSCMHGLLCGDGTTDIATCRRMCSLPNQVPTIDCMQPAICTPSDVLVRDGARVAGLCE